MSSIVHVLSEIVESSKTNRKHSLSKEQMENVLVEMTKTIIESSLTNSISNVLEAICRQFPVVNSNTVVEVLQFCSNIVHADEHFALLFTHLFNNILSYGGDDCTLSDISAEAFCICFYVLYFLALETLETEGTKHMLKFSENTLSCLLGSDSAKHNQLLNLWQDALQFSCTNMEYTRRKFIEFQVFWLNFFLKRIKASLVQKSVVKWVKWLAVKRSSYQEKKNVKSMEEKMAFQNFDSTLMDILSKIFESSETLRDYTISTIQSEISDSQLPSEYREILLNMLVQLRISKLTNRNSDEVIRFLKYLLQLLMEEKCSDLRQEVLKSLEQLIFDFPFDSASKNRILDKLITTVELDPSQTIRLKAIKLTCRFAIQNSLFKFLHVLVGRCMDKDKRIRIFCFGELKKHVKVLLSKQDSELEKNVIKAIDLAVREQDNSLQNSARQLLIDVFSQNEEQVTHWITLLFAQIEYDYCLWETYYVPWLRDALTISNFPLLLETTDYVNQSAHWDDVDEE